MTTVRKEKCKCAVRGAENECHVLMSTSSFGSPDLDLRPPELQRFTMSYWLQECCRCGYVSKKITDKPKVTPEFLESEEYVSCSGIKFKSELAELFYKYYLISLESKDTEEAFFAVVHTAWGCDDKNDRDNANICRMIAVHLHPKLRQDENRRVMKMDLLRRSGQFEALITEYSSVKFSQDILNKIAKFQLKKAAEGDTACYTVADVVEK